MTLPLARGRCNSILRPFLRASGGVGEGEMGSLLGALSIKTSWTTEERFLNEKSHGLKNPLKFWMMSRVRM